VESAQTIKKEATETLEPGSKGFFTNFPEGDFTRLQRLNGPVVSLFKGVNFPEHPLYRKNRNCGGAW
jgi:hypothetical protein